MRTVPTKFWVDKGLEWHFPRQGRVWRLPTAEALLHAGRQTRVDDLLAFFPSSIETTLVLSSRAILCRDASPGKRRTFDMKRSSNRALHAQFSCPAFRSGGTLSKVVEKKACLGIYMSVDELLLNIYETDLHQPAVQDPMVL